MALTSEQIDQITQKLKTRRKELRDIIQNELFNAGHESLAGQVHDSGEESLADLLVGLDVAIAEIDTQELEEIRAALNQIEAGQYGICTDCGVDISTARLETQPAAVRCIDCQEMFEERGALETPRL